MALFGAEIPFAENCGVQEIGLVDGKTQVRLVNTAAQTNNVGVMHGGLLCTLLDVAMGSAARCLIGHPVMTLDIHVSFLSPAMAPIRAEGRVVRAGRSVLFCEAEATDQNGTPVAKASGIFKPARQADSARSTQD